MKQSISKLVFVLALITLLSLFFVLVSFAVKTALMENKAKIEEQISGYLDKPATIGSIDYLPPFFIVLKDVAVHGNGQNSDNFPLSIKRITLVFSLKEIITKKQLFISKIYLIQPKIDFFKYPLFLKESIDGIVEIINLLAQGRPLKIVMEDSQYILERKGSASRAIIANAKLKIGPGFKIVSYGDVNLRMLSRALGQEKQTDNVFVQPIKYNFFGRVTPKGFSIDTLNFASGKFQLDLKGSLEDSILNLSGFSTIDDFYKQEYSINQENKLINHIRNLIVYKRVPQKVNVSPTSLNILDINFIIRFASKKINLEQATMVINNIPLKIKADIDFLEKTALNISLSTFAQQALVLRKNNPRSLDMDFSCAIDEGNLDGKMNLGFLKGSANNYAVQVIKALFNNASFGLTPDQRIKLFVKQIILQYKADKIYDFSLSDFDLLFNLMNKDLKVALFNSDIYGGRLAGNVALDISDKPLKTRCVLKVEDVSANEMETVLLSLFGAYRKLQAKFTGKVDGKFACDLVYNSYPRAQMQGHLEIKNGFLENVRFFVWLSEFFNIPALTRVDFANISAKFKITDELAMLEEIDLASEKINLAGNFSLKNNEMLSSQLSISIARELLSQSSKFQLLLALMRNDTTAVNFVFQLSGLYKSPNFKWLESDFKDKIKKILPGFLERGIEKKIEKAIQSIAD
ncbi:MAG: AsmA-like C-terminal region-containing protein [Candidatus Omnitrophica bacterium]|nr:AsmA-like C-terminal region-containing protein [Candidatus Omnitrophota bacterium]